MGSALMLFLSTPSARRATDLLHQLLQGRHISIHALREEGDDGWQSPGKRDVISIHALREEGDMQGSVQSGTTMDFYPRPPRGGRPDAGKPGRTGSTISIHALREEGDVSVTVALVTLLVFLSTPSARRATEPQKINAVPQWISIHALREEGDANSQPLSQVID